MKEYTLVNPELMCLDEKQKLLYHLIISEMVYKFKFFNRSHPGVLY